MLDVDGFLGGVHWVRNLDKLWTLKAPADMPIHLIWLEKRWNWDILRLWFDGFNGDEISIFL